MVIGIDEVGRGAWAGPMLFCAVSLREKVEGLTDSKKIGATQRKIIAENIKLKANYVGYGWVTPQEIDDLGLTKASSLACKRALKKAPKVTKIIIDGKVNFLKENKFVECMVDADENIPEVSAASILAKVKRDDFMNKISQTYPSYNFEKNVGYGTKHHQDAIKKYGLTPLHRWSYKPIKEHLDNYDI